MRQASAWGPLRYAGPYRTTDARAGCLDDLQRNGESRLHSCEQSASDVYETRSMSSSAMVPQVNIDDCWQLTNRTLPWSNPKARQIANPYHFPSGMKALADHLHNLNPPMKLGVYTARCKYTCQLFAASFGHEEIDAQQWAEWGVDCACCWLPFSHARSLIGRLYMKCVCRLEDGRVLRRCAAVQLDRMGRRRCQADTCRWVVSRSRPGSAASAWGDA